MTAEEAAPWSDLVGSFGAYQLEKNPRLFSPGSATRLSCPNRRKHAGEIKQVFD